MNDLPVIGWTESGEPRSALWRSEGGVLAPTRVVIANDNLGADDAYRLACEGTAILWRGDFDNARQLLQALSRRVEHKQRSRQRKDSKSTRPLAETFRLYRQSQAQRAHILGMLLVTLESDYRIPLRRAPDVQQACMEAYGPGEQASVLSLRELLGLIGAHEWRKKGVPIPALDDRIHPHYGVFSPVRGEYVTLVAEAPLPSLELAFDVGTGTGVLAAVLARRGVVRVVATDKDPRALACARENILRLGLSGQVEIVSANLFPEGRAPLIVCNPPWIPARPSSPLEHAVYDPESRMLLGFINGLAAHLKPGAEGWLILSDIAERLGLRTRDELLMAIDVAGLKVAGKLDVRPRHPKTLDVTDPLHAARAGEITSLWRLAAR
ncbi:MAG TPA: class I SAM-dependent methyltransferase [Spirochaetia bacterium]|nr:class I SAM-dependent methyltransferase [Spirochaetia bacterium]